MTEILLVLLAIPVWVYAGYPALAWLLRKVSMHPIGTRHPAWEWPRLTLVVAARNEEREIGHRLANLCEMDYPAGRLEVIVASDSSTDRTDAIVASFAGQGIRLVRGPGGGKSSAQSAALVEASGEVVVFSDANNLYRPETLRRLIEPFADPTVGCTVGRVTYVNQDATAVTRSEGAYWRYELGLRSLESDLGILVMGSGPIMAVRRELIPALAPDESEDFALPLQAHLMGRRTVYVPDAVSDEILYQDQPAAMYRAKVRVVSKDLVTLLRHARALDPRRGALVSIGLLSHKLLRWNVGFALLALLVLSLAAQHNTCARVLLTGEAVAYSLAGWGALARRWYCRAPRLASLAFFFCLVHVAACHGMVRVMRGRWSGAWEPIRADSPARADSGCR